MNGWSSFHVVFHGYVQGLWSSVRGCIGQIFLRELLCPVAVGIQHWNREHQKFTTMWILGKVLTKTSIQPFLYCLLFPLPRSLFPLPILCCAFLPSLLLLFPVPVFFPAAFPLLMFTYLRLGLSCSSCQAAGSCCTKSVLPVNGSSQWLTGGANPVGQIKHTNTQAE